MQLKSRINLNNDLRLYLSASESNAIKGLALIFLLIHHLFYFKNGQYDDIEIRNGIGIVNMIGLACKVCVPMFVFLSGYGLTAVAEKTEKINLKRFYAKRFSKLYLNYWLIWFLFVPIGIFFFDITFDKVYGNQMIEKFVLDFFGLINLTGSLGYNPTWWFYSCIIILYLIFPFILTGCKIRLFTHLILWSSVALTFSPILYIQPIRYYLLTFILGCYFRNGLIYILLPSHLKKFTSKTINGKLNSWETIILIGLTIISIPVRFMISYTLVFDTLITILIVLSFKNLKINPRIYKSLEFCGKHSINIFLFHTFLFALYIPQIIYWHKNPVIILITLLFFCLSISVGIEYCKKKIGFYKLLSRF